MKYVLSRSSVRLMSKFVIYDQLRVARQRKINQKDTLLMMILIMLTTTVMVLRICIAFYVLILLI